MKHGDFTGLAQDYAKYRPGYSKEIAHIIISEQSQFEDFSAIDIGAGTGIWTKILAENEIKKLIAVEPNSDMISQGKMTVPEAKWIQASAEKTEIEANSAHLITMASSFHWTNFEIATREFHRILNPGGLFTALWNPRYLEASPLLMEIEDELRRIVPKLKRVSSGTSAFTENLSQRLEDTGLFQNVVYLESKHVELQSPERYLGLWRSVNDIRVQAGQKRFDELLSWIEQKISGLENIEATYLTKAWIARRKD
jgi:ubiquinone/menaquinone biosynthesis C-methylase UbiE